MNSSFSVHPSAFLVAASGRAVLLLGIIGICGCVSSGSSRQAVNADHTSPAVRDVLPVFADETREKRLPEISADYVNWLDYNGDGYPDLLVNGARLLRNDAGKCFTDVTEACGLSGKGGPALAVDLSNDGWPDIVTVRGAMWINQNGAGFIDQAKEMGFSPGEKGNVIGAGDIDADGYADLYIGMKEDWNSGDARYYEHELWLNLGGCAWCEIGEQAGIRRSTYARSILFSDVNGDGRPDIFVGNYRLQPNILWINQGDETFSDEAASYGLAGRRTADTFYDPLTRRHYGYHYGHTIGAAWFDVENDGDLDLFVANLVHKYVGPGSLEGLRYDFRGYVCDDSGIFLRTGSRFSESRERLNLPRMPVGGPGIYRGDELWAGCAVGDANNDGWQDVFVPQIYNLSYARTLLLLNRKGEEFIDVAPRSGICRIDTYAGAWADIDCDGWLDLATGGRPQKDGPSRLTFYRNLTGSIFPAFRWLKVRLVSGRDRGTVLGTRVQVLANGVTRLQEYGAGTSTYGQQNGPLLHFGLGPVGGDTPIEVQAQWPDGRTTRATAVANTVLTMEPPQPWAATAAR